MTHDQDLADRLGETLHRRADALHDTPLDLLDVRGRATSIRRRRHAVVGVAAAVRGRRRGRARCPCCPTGGDDRGLDLQPAETITPIPEPVRLDPRTAPEGDGRRGSRTSSSTAKQLVTPAAHLRPARGLPRRSSRTATAAGSRCRKGHPGTGITVKMLDSDFGVVDGARRALRRPRGPRGRRARGVHRVRRRRAVAAAHHGAAPRRGLHLHRRRHPQQRAGVRPTGRLRLRGRRGRRGDRPGHRPYHLPGGGRRRRPRPSFGGFNRVVSTVVGLRPGRRADRVHRRRLLLRRPGPALGRPGPRVGDVRPPLGAFSPDGTLHRRAGGVLGRLRLTQPSGSSTPTTGEPVVDFVSGNDRARRRPPSSDVVWEDATTLLATVDQGNEEYVVRGSAIDGPCRAGRRSGRLAG